MLPPLRVMPRHALCAGKAASCSAACFQTSSNPSLCKVVCQRAATPEWMGMLLNVLLPAACWQLPFTSVAG